MDNSNIKLVELPKRKKSNKTLIWVLAILVAMLFVANVVLISFAYFSDTKSSQSIVTFGTVKIDGYVKNGTTKERTISLDSNQLIAGSATTKNVTIEVTGNSSCFVRVSGSFLMNISGDTYVPKTEFINFYIDTDSSTNANWVKDGDYYYYTQPLSSSATTNVEVTFEVSKDLGNSSLDNTTEYNNKAYKILVTIESCQEYGSNLIVDNAFHPENWIAYSN
jgi:hypothetical protein